MNRWTIRRKAKLIGSINRGEITSEEARAMHDISQEELDSWFQLFSHHGLNGLRVTRSQDYRIDG